MKQSIVVVKISGSAFAPNNVAALHEIVRPIADIRKTVQKAVLVAGGGEIARRYIDAGRQLGMDESSLDEIGIDISRVNARLLVGSLSRIAYPSIPKTLEEVAGALRTSDIVCCGGFHPGHSTNAVAAMIAERVSASLLVNSTDVDGVYSSDPRLDKQAILLESIDARKLAKMLEQEKMTAGTYDLMDLLALKIIQRSKIPTVICKCTGEALRKALSFKDVGTKILL